MWGDAARADGRVSRMSGAEAARLRCSGAGQEEGGARFDSAELVAGQRAGIERVHAGSVSPFCGGLDARAPLAWGSFQEGDG